MREPCPAAGFWAPKLSHSVAAGGMLAGDDRARRYNDATPRVAREAASAARWSERVRRFCRIPCNGFVCIGRVYLLDTILCSYHCGNHAWL